MDTYLYFKYKLNNFTIKLEYYVGIVKRFFFHMLYYTQYEQIYFSYLP